MSPADGELGAQLFYVPLAATPLPLAEVSWVVPSSPPAPQVPIPGPIPWTSLLASRGASLGEGRKGEHVDTLPAGLWKLWL